jgi:hypothetical protein
MVEAIADRLGCGGEAFAPRGFSGLLEPDLQRGDERPHMSLPALAPPHARRARRRKVERCVAQVQSDLHEAARKVRLTDCAHRLSRSAA